MTDNFTRYYLNVEFLSPVHIGCGESWGGESWLVDGDSDSEENQLNIVNLPRLINLLPEKLKLKTIQILQDGSYAKVKSILDDPAIVDCVMENADAVVTYQIDCTDEYDTLSKMREQDKNQGIIHQFYRSGNQLFLPGSSLKGSIRTALMNGFLDSSKRRQLADLFEKERPRKYNEIVLEYRDAKSDPFRLLSISDLPLPEDSTCIQSTLMVGGKKQAVGLPIVREVTKWTVPAVSGEMRLFPGLIEHSKKVDTAKGGVTEKWKDKFTAKEIFAACNAFYKKRFFEECDTFSKFISSDFEAQIKNQFQSLKPNECIIRVGRHSHIECVTLGMDKANPENSLPVPRVPQRNGKKIYGKSRTYVGGDLPMGWVKLSYS